MPLQNVFLVDDDPAILRLLKVKLSKEGYDVLTFTDSREALRAIENSPPEFLVTDWEMPGMNGIELCRQVRSLNLSKYTYVVILTSRTGQEQLTEGLMNGADDFVTKTHLDHSELIARLKAGGRIIELERRLFQMAHTDPLTGIMNRRSFFEQVCKEWERSSRHQLPISFIMMDIDYFKRVNDNHGHAVGDAVLCQVAEILNTSLRRTETLCRYGGEEFCVMLPETDEKGAKICAERLRKLIAATEFRVEELTLNLTTSIGLSVKSDDRQNAEQLIDQADQALLVAKESGRNRVISYDSITASENENLTIQGALAERMAGVTARDVLVPIEQCLHEYDTVYHAVDYFLASGISPAPVVDNTGKLIGVLSEKELLAVMTRPEIGDETLQEHDLVRPAIVWYESAAPIRAIFNFFSRVVIPRVLILDDGVPVGSISRLRLLRWGRENLLDPERSGCSMAPR